MRFELLAILGDVRKGIGNATVNTQYLPGDESTILGGEQRNHGGDVLRGSELGC
jgi:hypothetical protein